MSKLGSYKRIITSDFAQDDRQLVEKLANPINQAFDQLFFCLNGRVDFKNNIAGTVKDVDVTVNALGIPINQTTFNLDREGQVLGTLVMSAINQDNSNTYPLSSPFITFTQLSNSLLINHVTGLQPNQRYTLRVLAFN